MLYGRKFYVVECHVPANSQMLIDEVSIKSCERVSVTPIHKSEIQLSIER